MQQQLAKATVGKGFMLMGGDSAESFDEFNVAMKRLGLNVATSEVKKLFMEFDPDDSGEVDFRELNKAWRKGAGDASPRQHALSAGFRRS